MINIIATRKQIAKYSNPELLSNLKYFKVISSFPLSMAAYKLNYHVPLVIFSRPEKVKWPSIQKTFSKELPYYFRWAGVAQWWQRVRFRAGVICRLSLSLVLALLRGFLSRFSGFYHSIKTNTLNFNSTRIEDRHGNQLMLLPL